MLHCNTVEIHIRVRNPKFSSHGISERKFRIFNADMYKLAIFVCQIIVFLSFKNECISEDRARSVRQSEGVTTYRTTSDGAKVSDYVSDLEVLTQETKNDVASLESELKEKDQIIFALHDEINNIKKQIFYATKFTENSHKACEKEAERAKLAYIASEQRAIDLEKELSEKDTVINTQNFEKELSSTQNELNNKNRRISELEIETKDLQNQIASLMHQHKETSGEYNESLHTSDRNTTTQQPKKQLGRLIRSNTSNNEIYTYSLSTADKERVQNALNRLNVLIYDRSRIAEAQKSSPISIKLSKLASKDGKTIDELRAYVQNFDLLSKQQLTNLEEDLLEIQKSVEEDISVINRLSKARPQ